MGLQNTRVHKDSRGVRDARSPPDTGIAHELPGARLTPMTAR
jgi:hypothetical protein